MLGHQYLATNFTLPCLYTTHIFNVISLFFQGLENILVDLWNPRRDELWIREITKTRKEVTQE